MVQGLGPPQEALTSCHLELHPRGHWYTLKVTGRPPRNKGCLSRPGSADVPGAGVGEITLGCSSDTPRAGGPGTPQAPSPALAVSIRGPGHPHDLTFRLDPQGCPDQGKQLALEHDGPVMFRHVFMETSCWGGGTGVSTAAGSEGPACGTLRHFQGRRMWSRVGSLKRVCTSLCGSFTV